MTTMGRGKLAPLCIVGLFLACSSGDAPDPQATSATGTTGTTSSSSGGSGCASPADCDDGSDCTEDRCEGQVCANLPLATGTACGSGLCDAAGRCASGLHRWSKLFGDDKSYGRTVVVMPSGDIVLGGQFSGSIDFGGGALQATGAAGYDLVFAGLAADGAQQWARSFEGAGVVGLARGAGADLFAAGAFTDSLDLGTGGLTSAGGYDALVARMDATGSAQWVERFGDVGDDGAGVPSVDGEGRIAVAGSFDGSIDFGAGPIAAEGSTRNDFVAKLDPAGAVLWARTFYLEGPFGALRGVASATTGESVLVGSFGGGGTAAAVDVGTGVLQTPPGDTGGLVFKLDASGNTLWARQLNLTSGSVRPLAVAIDDTDGSVAVVGEFYGQVDFGGPTVIETCPMGGGAGAFVLKLDAGGNFAWVATAPCTGTFFLNGAAIDVDAGGSIVCTFNFTYILDWGGGAVTAQSDADIALSKFAADGTHLWTQTFGKQWTNYSRAIDIGPSGEIVMVGNVGSDIDFGGGLLTTGATYPKMFVAVFDP